MSDGAGRRFFGGLVVAMGGLIATLSGLCSFGFVAMTLAPALKGPGVVSNLLLGGLLVGVVGGIPFTIGVALIIAGLGALRRSSSAPGR